MLALRGSSGLVRHISIARGVQSQAGSLSYLLSFAESTNLPRIVLKAGKPKNEQISQFPKPNVSILSLKP